MVSRLEAMVALTRVGVGVVEKVDRERLGRALALELDDRGC